jgi:hypothetical protein
VVVVQRVGQVLQVGAEHLGAGHVARRRGPDQPGQHPELAPEHPVHQHHLPRVDAFSRNSHVDTLASSACRLPASGLHSYARPVLSCRVLGPTEIVADARPVELGGPQPRRLITALVAAEGRPVTDDRLAEAIWGDGVPARAETSLQAYVSRLRRVLGREALPRAGNGYRVAAGRIDAADFVAEVERGRALLAGDRAAEARGVFDAALALWRGTAYAATLRAAVRRQAVRRGLKPEVTDPVNAAALDAALGPSDPGTGDPDEAAMIAMLATGHGGAHARG